ncbi:MAG: cellulase family glycosylhydrolase [Bacteroidota bacterium]
MNNRLLLPLLVLLMVKVNLTFAQRVTVDGSQFKKESQTLFLSGINSPWQNDDQFRIDFLGTDHFDLAYWQNEFDNMAANNVNTVRIWVHGRGNHTPAYDPNGFVLSPTTQFYDHMDAVIDLAAEKEIYVLVTMWSFDMLLKQGNGQPGSDFFSAHRATMTDVNKTISYVSNFLAPVVDRYKDNPYILGYDIINEPEHIWENANDLVDGAVSRDQVIAFIARCAAKIHEASGNQNLVTVGSKWSVYNSDRYIGFGGIPFAGDNFSDQDLQAQFNDADAFLDFYSMHWYQWQSTGAPFIETAVALFPNVTKPIVITEFPGLDLPNNDCGCTCATPGVCDFSIDLNDTYEAVLSNGFAGITAWRNGQENDFFGQSSVIYEATNYLASIRPDLVFPEIVEQIAPQNLVISNVTATSFHLTWDPLVGASGVNVFLVDDTNGSGDVYLTTLPGDATNYAYSGVEGSITLTEGNSYTAKVQALPDDDFNAYASASVTTQSVEQTAPPQNLQITNRTDEGFRLSWDPLTGTSGVNVFIVDVTNGGGDTYITTLPASATFFDYSGTYGNVTVTPGNEYEAKIQALPDQDFNAFTAVSVIAGREILEQSAPTNLAIADVTDSSFVLSWTPLTGASGINVFLVDETSGSGDVYLTTLPGDATSYAYSGTEGSLTIVGENDYTAKVQALPDADFNAFAGISVRTVAPIVDQNAPQNLATSNVTRTSFLLTWDPLVGASGVNVFLAEVDGGSGDVYLTTLPGDATSYSYSGTEGSLTIVGGTRYRAKIQALPDENFNAFAEVSVTTLPPITEQVAPQNLQIGNVTENSFQLTWDPLVGASGVNVFLVDETNGSGDVYLTTLPGDATSYSFSGTEGSVTIVGSNRYLAKVQALPDADFNAFAEAAVETLPPITEQVAPQNLQISDVTDSSFVLTWDPLVGASGVNVFLVDETNVSGDVYLTTLSGEATSYAYSGTEGSVTITGGNRYVAKVQALPDADFNAFAEIAVQTLDEVIDQVAPQNLTITDVTDSSFMLSWDPLVGATGVNVFLAEVDGGSGDVYLTTLPGDATSYAYAGTEGSLTIVGGTRYRAKIQALPDADFNGFAETSVETLPTEVEQEAPQNLMITDVTDSSFILSWDALVDASGVNVFLVDETNGSGDVYLTTLPGDATSYAYSGTEGSLTIVGGTRYRAKIQALPDADFNGFAELELSTPTPLPAAPTGLSVDRGVRSFTVSWDKVENATAINVFIVHPRTQKDFLVATIDGEATSYFFSRYYDHGRIRITPFREYTVKIQALPAAADGSTSEVKVERKVNYNRPGRLPYWLKAYPNPVYRYLYLKNYSWSVQLDKVVIRNAAGKEINQYAAARRIDMSKLRRGVYIAEFVDTEGNIVATIRLYKY